jgi:chitin disaccharide deacetylase
VVIVNADDFGLSETVDLAIVQAFERGLISSATLMANGTAYDHAAGLVAAAGLQEHVGLHFVLTEGAPLSEPIRRCARFCDGEGRFRGHRAAGRLVRLRRDERDAIAAELRAQLARCRRDGVPVTHLDSHHHVHTEPGVLPIAIAIARETQVPWIRLTRNLRPGVPPGARLYRTLHNLRLRRSGLARTRWFGDVDDYAAARAAGVPEHSLHDLELMTHPALDDDLELVDFHCSRPGMRLAELVADVPRLSEAVSYTGARL